MANDTDIIGTPGLIRPLGGRVSRTGLTALRRGERVVPGPDAEAQIVLAEQDTRHEIHIELPVIVEVVGGAQTDLVARAAAEAVRLLRQAFEARPVEA